MWIVQLQQPGEIGEVVVAVDLSSTRVNLE